MSQGDRVRQVLEACGIAFGDKEYGFEYNLCFAAMTGGLGIRRGSSERVKEYLREHDLAPIVSEKMLAFMRVIAAAL